MFEFLAFAVATISAACAAVWANSAIIRRRAWHRTKVSSFGDAQTLAQAAYRQHFHAVILYLSVAVLALAPLLSMPWATIVGLCLLIPASVTFWLARNARRDADIFITLLDSERRAVEIVEQEPLATKRWAARLVPESLPEFASLDMARESYAASGMMTGDFLDVVALSEHRIAVVIGDAAGHGIDASITAFQAKYVLRSFLRQYRDPAQVLEVLNRHMASLAPEEELMSAFIAIIDTRVNVLRYASAGHCTCWATKDHEPVALRSTGPLLMLDPNADYASREIAFGSGEALLMYTDGIIESRRGSMQFGSDKVVSILRRELSSPVDGLCRAVVSAANAFSDGANTDDITVLAVRRR